MGRLSDPFPRAVPSATCTGRAGLVTTTSSQDSGHAQGHTRRGDLKYACELESQKIRLCPFRSLPNEVAIQSKVNPGLPLGRPRLDAAVWPRASLPAKTESGELVAPEDLRALALSTHPSNPAPGNRPSLPRTRDPLAPRQFFDLQYHQENPGHRARQKQADPNRGSLPESRTRTVSCPFRSPAPLTRISSSTLGHLFVCAAPAAHFAPRHTLAVP